jgi:L-2,4-diaminobutyric acid acetyltransferase
MDVIALTIGLRCRFGVPPGLLLPLLTSLRVAVSVGSPEIVIDHPVVTDGVACWQLASDSRVLDVNSRYAYLLWFRDFAATSVVARRGGDVIGFVTGYRRSDEPSTLMVWQVAVAEAARGRGLASAMLDALVDRVPVVDHVETTITPDNRASVALFTGFADRRRAPVRRNELFGADLLGTDHEPEILFRIGPIR